MLRGHLASHSQLRNRSKSSIDSANGPSDRGGNQGLAWVHAGDVGCFGTSVHLPSYTGGVGGLLTLRASLQMALFFFEWVKDRTDADGGGSLVRVRGDEGEGKREGREGMRRPPSRLSPRSWKRLSSGQPRPSLYPPSLGTGGFRPCVLHCRLPIAAGGRNECAKSVCLKSV